MHLHERGRGVPREAEGRAEGAPVGSGEDVSVLNQNNGLALAGNARAEQRIQIVDLGQVRRHDRIGVTARWVRECELRSRLAHLVHGVGSKIVQRNHARNDRSECGGNARVAHVGNVALPSYLEMMDFSLEGPANLTGGAGKINEHSAGIDDIDLEAVRLEPGGDGVKVWLGESETVAKFLRGDPMMKIGRAFGVKLVDE